MNGRLFVHATWGEMKDAVEHWRTGIDFDLDYLVGGVWTKQIAGDRKVIWKDFERI